MARDKIGKVYIKVRQSSKHRTTFAIIDSGSEKSMITMDIVEKLQLQNKLLPVYNELKTLGYNTRLFNYEIEVAPRHSLVDN